MNKKETVFGHDVVAALESAGSFCFNIHGHRYQKSGMPDLYVANTRWTGWIELKVDKGTVKDIQNMKIKDLLRRGVPAFVVRLREGVVYCELGKETLAWAKNWNIKKGQARGLGLLQMFNDAGEIAIKIMKG